MRGRRGVYAATVILGAASVGLLSSPVTVDEQPVTLVEVVGVITPVVADYIEDAVQAAEADVSQALVVTLDTPGGLDVSMREIVQKFLNAEVPGTDFRSVGRRILAPLVGAVGMALVILGLKLLLGDAGLTTQVVIYVIAGAVVYLAVIRAIDRSMLREATDLGPDGASPSWRRFRKSFCLSHCVRFEA